MKYSRNKINQAGKLIASSDADILKQAEAITVVDSWRKDHLPVLSDLISQVSRVLDDKHVPVAFSSQRLKRMTSIIDKLIHNPEMGLGGVQDIGGARFVFDGVEQLEKARQVIAEAHFRGFELDRTPYDYIEHPKSSGYRSIHYVYKYKSDDESLDGKRVELQIRTKLQHDWATAVETGELISKSALKAGVGDESWLHFFKLVSAIFSRKEGLPVNEDYTAYTQKEYCEEFARIDGKTKFVEQLRALVGAVNIVETESFRGGYVVLLLDYDQKRVRFRHFKDTERTEAMDLYAQLENSIVKERNAVVLVSVSDMNELRSAYPSYFMNAREFIDALADFTETCRMSGYIA